MAGASSPSLSIAVANAGGLGACGALLMTPDAIATWSAEVRAATNGPFQLNLWIPDPPPMRDPGHEAKVRAFLAKWGPEVSPQAGDATPPDFAAQCEALLEAAPQLVANISTVAEARAAEEAGADVVVAQGMEAGGHRGCFDAARGEATMVGLFALLPAVVDAVRVPVVATGGIADPRGVAAALLLGASAVQIGTGFLRCPEAKLNPAWADALARTPPEGTALSRAFSGRVGRSISTAYVRAATEINAPPRSPYPMQRGLTQAMRDEASKAGDVERMQAWAGQAAAMARAEPAGELAIDLWKRGRALLMS